MDLIVPLQLMLQQLPRQAFFLKQNEKIYNFNHASNATEFTFSLFCVSKSNKINVLETIHLFILNILTRTKKLP